jgi:hypothetical protein
MHGEVLLARAMGREQHVSYLSEKGFFFDGPLFFFFFSVIETGIHIVRAS